MQIQLSKYQKSLFYEIFISKEYEILDKIIKNSSTIFDIGSNIWLFSLYALSKKYDFEIKLNWDFLFIPDEISIKNDIIIHLFEPNSDIFELQKRVLLKFWAVTRENNFWLVLIPGAYEFIVPEIDCQGSLYDSFLTKKKWSKIKVELRNLWDYMDENNIEAIDLMKMDIEWAEFEVLLGLEEKYFKKIKVLFFEYHIVSDDFEKKFEILQDKLQRMYMSVEVMKWKYSEKIGYVICKY